MPVPRPSVTRRHGGATAVPGSVAHNSQQWAASLRGESRPKPEPKRRGAVTPQRRFSRQGRQDEPPHDEVFYPGSHFADASRRSAASPRPTADVATPRAGPRGRWQKTREHGSPERFSFPQTAWPGPPSSAASGVEESSRKLDEALGAMLRRNLMGLDQSDSPPQPSPWRQKQVNRVPSPEFEVALSGGTQKPGTRQSPTRAAAVPSTHTTPVRQQFPRHGLSPGEAEGLARPYALLPGGHRYVRQEEDGRPAPAPPPPPPPSLPTPAPGVTGVIRTAFSLAERGEQGELKAEYFASQHQGDSTRDTVRTVRQLYGSAFDLYFRALEQFDAARSLDPAPAFQGLCLSKLTHYMGRCEMVRKKRADWLVAAGVPLEAGDDPAMPQATAVPYQQHLELATVVKSPAHSRHQSPVRWSGHASGSDTADASGEEHCKVASTGPVTTTITTRVPVSQSGQFLPQHTIHAIRAMLEHAEGLEQQCDTKSLEAGQLLAHHRSRARLRALKKMIANGSP
eukprot:TRINITY_DN16554_c0_g1_i2.p1 TRINITY_DN16554_c0_g1~~TRINITY_DN16554_c0_g1_i2.p1  ORF type:complete len:511 (+),score=126.14 TRINITY_DN16554_c0_g1_i2:243-1775(+)